MALIPQVKCSRCERSYSGLRSRCPYCGTRRASRSVKAEVSNTALYKYLIAALLLVVLIGAVITLVVTNKTEGETPVEPTTPTEPSEATTVIIPPPTENTPTETTPTETTSTEVPPTEPTVEPTTPDTPPRPTVTSVVMTFNGNRVGVEGSDGRREFTLTRREGSIQLGVRISPEGVDYTPVWESTNESAATVSQTGKVTWVGAGESILRVTVDGESNEVKVRCSK